MKVRILLVYLALLLSSPLVAVLLSFMLPAGFSPVYALPIGALSLLLLSRWLSRGRRVVPCSVVHVAVVGIALVAFAFLPFRKSAAVLGPTNRLVERLIGETPQTKVSSYLELVASGAHEEALAQWPALWAASDRLAPQYEVRRQSVTSQLEELRPELMPRVLNIEWWGTCCEPHLTTDSRDAGFARLWVEVSRADESRQYVFDVLVLGGPYLGEMQGYPVRHWQIVDVYPVGEEPLLWGWPYSSAD